MRRTRSANSMLGGGGVPQSRWSPAARLLAAGVLLSGALLLAASAQLRGAPDALGVATLAAQHDGEGAAAAHVEDAAPARRAPAPLVAIADLHGDSSNALLALQLRRASAAAPSSRSRENVP
jgi:hypothetical protein